MRRISSNKLPTSYQVVMALLALALTGCGDSTENSTEQLVAEMNQRIATVSRADAVDKLIPRFNQSKSLGCFNATFRVHEDINEKLKQGIFATPKTYRAKLRFANASTQDDSKKDLRGLSIKLFGVHGKPLWNNGDESGQDFLLNSYPALFVATPEDFLSFIKAREHDKKLAFFINPLDSHLKSLWILLKARKKHDSPFDIRYWSTTPFKHGETDMAVKYSMTPCSVYQTESVVDAGKDQLRAAMSAHLKQATACFNFGIQRQIDSDAMPIENASVIWDEKESPFQTVATITIKEQAFDSPEMLAACEKISFNPWHSLPAHQPLGRMNEVRREVYEHAEKLRNAEVPQ